MSFPQTRHTLIQRLASGGSERDWHDFAGDYWGPVCRFALRRRNIKLDEADDVASQTFEVVLRNRLLQRWITDRRAKLRTLLCSVVCKIQSNRGRVQHRKEWLVGELEKELGSQHPSDAPSEHIDAFYAAWVEDLLQRCLHELAIDYHSQGKGDYFRVIYGRLCERLTIAEVASALQISHSAVDNYYRHVKKRLGEKLEEALHNHVQRYCAVDGADDEFAEEWGRLGAYIKDNGGLEDAVRRTYDAVYSMQLATRKANRVKDALTRISSGATVARPRK